MKNFERELAKSIKRLDCKSTPRRFYTNILEDKFQLEHSLEGCVYSENGYDFSISFINILGGASNLDNYYVIDGLSYWFNKLNLSDTTLTRCSSLLVAIYNLKFKVYREQVLIDNPWLLPLFSYSNENTGFNLIKNVNKVKSQIRGLCSTSLSDEFMPKGIWGLDILLKSRVNNPPSNLLTIGDGLNIIPANQYKREVL